MKNWIIIAWLMSAIACSAQTPVEPAAPTQPTPDSVTFEDVLKDYQTLNQRLDRVADRLKISNAPLCPQITRDPGFTVHSLGDYPEQIRKIAQEFLDVSTALSLRAVREGSSAYEAGLRTGDQLLALNGHGLPSGQTAQTMYRALSRSAFRQDIVSVSVRRETQNIRVNIRPENTCGYPVTVFFSEYVNARTDGEDIHVTSELVRQFKDDNSLALVIAHELAHAVAAYSNSPLSKTSRKQLELEADRMALIMMARAGYDMDAAITYWQNRDHPHPAGHSETHPDLGARLENFRKTQDWISRKLARGDTLTFETE